MTDGNGEFRFEGVAEGWVELEDERPGFFKPTEVDSGQGASSNLQVECDVIFA